MLRFPRLSFRRAIGTGVVAFMVFAGIATFLLAAVERLNRTEAGIALGAVGGGSILIGLTPYILEVVALAFKRATNYGKAAESDRRANARLANAAAFLRQLNTAVPIQEIRSKDGTVHLVFPHGTKSGLGKGMLIEVVRLTGGERLGTVRIVEAAEDWSLARPTDRIVPDFWDGLEDRMKSDFTPPAAVVGRIFRITGSTVADLLHLVANEEED